MDGDTQPRGCHLDCPGVAGVPRPQPDPDLEGRSVEPAQLPRTDGSICPSHASLAQAARCHESTALRALQAARELRLVRWVGRRVRAGWRALRSSNAYELRIPKEPVAEAEAPPYPRLLRAGSVRALIAAFRTNQQNAGGGETSKKTGLRDEEAGGSLGLELRRLAPHPPVRTVAEQIAMLLG
jgi:hypothetical protein